MSKGLISFGAYSVMADVRYHGGDILEYLENSKKTSMGKDYEKMCIASFIVMR